MASNADGDGVRRNTLSQKSAYVYHRAVDERGRLIELFLWEVAGPQRALRNCYDIFLVVRRNVTYLFKIKLHKFIGPVVYGRKVVGSVNR